MQSVDHLKECREFYTRELQSHFGVPLGTSESAISKLQQELGFLLPESYRQFLAWMGDDKRGALQGSEWFAEDVLPNGDFLDEFLTDNGVAEIVSAERVCFFVHQGYMAAWFIDMGSPNPKCFFFSEASSTPIITDAGTFTSFLLRELKGVAEAVKT